MKNSFVYGIERFDKETGLWGPTEEQHYSCRRDAAYRMITLNSRVPFGGQLFRVAVLENFENA